MSVAAGYAGIVFFVLLFILWGVRLTIAEDWQDFLWAWVSLISVGVGIAVSIWLIYTGRRSR